MIYLPIQPYSKIFYPLKTTVSLNWALLSLIVEKRKYATLTLAILSLLLGIIYVWEFNTILNFNEKIVNLNKEIKRGEVELDKNENNYSKNYSTALATYLNKENILERVSKIEYLEKKSLVEAVQYIP